MSGTILFVSEAQEKQEALGKALSQHAAGFKIVPAHGGNEAYVKARNQTFDAIVTCLDLAGLSGIDLINALKENYTNAKIPIILYGPVSPEMKEKLKLYQGVHQFGEDQTGNLLGDFVSSILKSTQQKQQASAPVKFDVNFINPFIEAVRHTLVTVAEAQNINVGKPYLLKKGDRLGIDISGTVSMMSPQFNGVLATCFPTKTYLNVVGKMLGEEYTEITSDIEDAAGELTNIIFGQTKKVLEQNGLKLEKAIPSVIRGENHSISHQSTGPILVTPFDSSLGQLFIQICMLKVET